MWVINKGVEMEKIGLDKFEVISVFKRILVDKVTEEPLIYSIAMAVGLAIEENNNKLAETLLGTLKRG